MHNLQAERSAVLHDAATITWGEIQGGVPYGTVQHAVALVSAFLNVVLQGGRVQGFEKFEAAKKFARDRHDSAPVIELAAIL